MANKKSTTDPLPPTLLYSLLRALGPDNLKKGVITAPAGKRVDSTAKNAFLAVVDAAKKAKSPAQFGKRFASSATTAASAPVITELTVVHQKDGTTVVTARFSDGRVFI